MTRRADFRLLLVALVGVDTLAVLVGVGGAGVLRIRLEDVLPFYNLATERHLLASFIVVPSLLILFWLQGLYDLDHILAGTREYSQIVHAVTYGVLIALGASYFAGGGPLVSRTWLLLVWVLGIGCVGLGRFTLRRLVRHLRRRGVLRTRVAIVGASSFGVAIAQQLRAARNEGLDVVGFLDEYLPLGQRLLDDVAVVGRPSDLLLDPPIQLAHEYILVPQALPFERQEAISYLMMSRQGYTLRIAVSSSDLLTHGVVVSERGSVPLITLRRARLEGLDVLLKEGLDRILAALALASLAPVALAALGWARLKGRHPLFSPYAIYGAELRRTTLWVLDAQVTQWVPLRGLPALLGVLTGHLSLVGPRPTIRQAGDLTAPAPSLTAVKPGLTGPWRLTGPHASLEDQATQDLSYVRNYSIWEDVHVLWESVRRLRGNRLTPLLGRWEDSSQHAMAPAKIAKQTELTALRSELATQQPRMYPSGRKSLARMTPKKSPDATLAVHQSIDQTQQDTQQRELTH